MREPGSLTWSELQTRDIPAAKRFYQQVFGWEVRTSPIGPGQPDYTEWMLDGESIGGAMDMQANVPAEVPPHWLAYFQVEGVIGPRIASRSWAGRS
jgi:predicted enzyme related to lactoylglutathione lyase